MATSPTVATLTATVVSTVNLVGEYNYVRIIPLSMTDNVYCSIDQVTNPTVAGDTFPVCPVGATTTIKVPFVAGSTQVKLISSGSGTVAVEGLRDPDDDVGDVRREGISIASLGAPPLPANLWAYNGVLTTTASTPMKAAGAGQLRNYITGFQWTNTSATATTINILDGAAVLWQGNAPASMTLPAYVNFATPIRGSAATALNVQCGTTAANVLTNAQGYQGF